ncbi:hypothetical protein [Alteromonas stellipolaris]|uniref:hypothetical protein n=1 Tax=Alteromonas stellipolaris TaxID=233316 RepID=UPI0026E1C991|nr:hypothetical protein [Alteromonas stellipolaris]MDO6533849.1 hypothetical protein [Alteromonas stellipolaris]MDO6626257.1 hypothetical protein [Alteromonas stellipolaris]
MKHFLAMIPIALLAGCNSDSEDGVVCTTEVIPGIAITVIDDVTEESISCGASAILQESSYEEELTNPESTDCDSTTLLLGALEREGFYNITVQKDGYEYWYAYDVEVVEGLCHVEQVEVEARLIPL